MDKKLKEVIDLDSILWKCLKCNRIRKHYRLHSNNEDTRFFCQKCGEIININKEEKI
jgi:hypothetical protein